MAAACCLIPSASPNTSALHRPVQMSATSKYNVRVQGACYAEAPANKCLLAAMNTKDA